MKKALWISMFFLMAFLGESCSVNSTDGAANKGTGPETVNPSDPGGTENPGNGGNGGAGAGASIDDICCGAQCYGGCKGVYLYACGGENFYSNITGTYAPANPQDLYAYFDQNCPVEMSDIPWYQDCPTNTSTCQVNTNTGYSGGGNSYCKQMGCGGLFCAGDCVGCPGC